jgi:hypothetical protein
MTANDSIALADLSDREVLIRVRAAARDERAATARLIALLIELDVRRLYLGEGCSSLFTYCTQVLHLSEHAAYNRIETARAARRFPLILELVESAAVTLTTVRLLAPHLTDTNHLEVLERARHKSKRNVELLVATLYPRPDVASTVRKLPVAQKAVIVPGPGTTEVAVAIETVAPVAPMPMPRPAEVKPLAPERYKIQITVSRNTYDKLRRAQDLLRHTVPSGDPAVIFERALGLLLDQLERARFAKTSRPRAAHSVKEGSRHVPASAKRAVWQRDRGHCAFNGPHGRCTETGLLEYHHLVPFASGGETSARNLELRCRAHNQYESDLWFGVTEQRHVREDRAAYGA